jgi:HAD superfamily hydrolase (TIGR01490 family)
METTFSKENHTPEKYIVFIDLDRTITSVISGRALARVALREGLMKPRDLINALYLSSLYKFRLKDPLLIIRNMTSWVKGIPEKSIIDLCNVVSREIILPGVYEEARGTIRSHKEKGARIVILSSSLSYLCREIADNLGIDDIICSSLEVRDGYLTGLADGTHCYGKEKADRLTEYCKKRNAVISDSWYYGDSESDLPVLALVGNPVCVNPERKLKRAALKRGWQILYWKH